MAEKKLSNLFQDAVKSYSGYFMHLNCKISNHYKSNILFCASNNFYSRMKKFLIIVLSVIVLLLICSYVFIPRQLEISKIGYAKCNINGAFRVLSDRTSWPKWWPGKDGLIKNNSKGKIFFFKKTGYHLTEKYYNSIQVQIKTGYSTIQSKINLIKLDVDSVVLIWKCEIPTGINPVSRFLKYREAENIKNDMTVILDSLGTFLDDKINVYGINLHVVMSKDSTMVLTKSFTHHYPTTSEVYKLVENLKKYIAGQLAKENNFPMLHVKILPDSTFETMVAIPVNRELAGNGSITFSRFVPWKVLTAEVKGGNKTVEEALHQMKVFISDFQISSMAIPFQSLVTDRSKEPDTSKWITRIYTPVP